MSATFTCPHCRMVYNTSGKSLGRRVRCKRCKHVFTAQADVRRPKSEPGHDTSKHSPIVEITVDTDDDDSVESGSDSSSGFSVDEAKRLWREAVKDGDSNDLSIRSEFLQAGAVDASSAVLFERSLSSSENSTSGKTEYELTRLLGKGGMGEVFAARQTSVDRPVAIKKILPGIQDNLNARSCFICEALVIGELDHPNIIPVHELGKTEDGTLFYAMKEVKGTPWDEVIEKNSEAENLKILTDVCDAISFAHDKGYVHRDLRPRNVMLGDYGEVLVMDWGLAVTTRPDGKAEPIRPSMSQGGTPNYMAPEMARCHGGKIGPCTDIYLLGAILFEIVTGLKAHTGETPIACIHNAAENIIQKTDKEGELLDIAMKAMASEPKDRYSSVEDLQEAIRGYQSHQESIVLCREAALNLKKAQKTGNYDTYAQALFGFQQGLDLWAENTQAKQGVANTQLEYAHQALENRDLDLAASLLQPEIEGHKLLLKEIEQARHDEQTRLVRQSQIRVAVQISAAVFAVGFLIGVCWILLKGSSARAAREVAEQALVALKSQRAEAEKAGAQAVTAIGSTRDLEKQLRKLKMLIAETRKKTGDLQLGVAAEKERLSVAEEKIQKGQDALADADIAQVRFKRDLSWAESMSDKTLLLLRMPLVQVRNENAKAKLHLAIARLNPGYFCEGIFTGKAGNVVEVNLVNTTVTDITPVAELPMIKRVRFNQDRVVKGIGGLRRCNSIEELSDTDGGMWEKRDHFWKRFKYKAHGISHAQVVAASKNKTTVLREIILPKGVVLQLIFIPAGKFKMGSGTGSVNERPVHSVRISRPFYMGRFEVTQSQWQAVMGKNPSKFKDGPDSLLQPVEQVSWEDITEKFMPAVQKYAPKGTRFCLPTEAQWEYACRAGRTTKYCFGSKDEMLDDYSWFKDNSEKVTHPAGKKSPNAWGLCDMHGNVCEWCADRYSESFYDRSRFVNPVNTTKGKDDSYVLRGGSWWSKASGCRAAARYKAEPSHRSFRLGFRLCLDISRISEVKLK